MRNEKITPLYERLSRDDELGSVKYFSQIGLQFLG